MRNMTLAAALVAAVAFSLPALLPAQAQTTPAAPMPAPANNAAAPPMTMAPHAGMTGPGMIAPTGNHAGNSNNAANAANTNTPPENTITPPETTAALPPAMPGPGMHRVSKLIGASVVNDDNKAIGKIDDIVIGPDHRALYAVISVGGFLGIGAKLVAVPYGELKLASDNKSMTLPGASKQRLESMPKFQYSGA